MPFQKVNGIGSGVERGRLIGSRDIVDEIALKIERGIEFRRQGRPKKNEKLICPLFLLSLPFLASLIPLSAVALMIPIFHDRLIDDLSTN